MIPLTIGCIPAGTVAKLPDGRVVIKRKDGIAPFGTNQLQGHLDPATPIEVLNV